MPNKMSDELNFSFLKRRGLFADANSCVEKMTLKEYYDLCLDMQQKGDINAALNYAEKASIEYGMQGLHLYFPLMIQWIQQQSDKGEWIQQDLKSILSLTHFIENVRCNEKDQKTIDTTNARIDELLAHCEDKEEVISEAKKLSKHYQTWSDPFSLIDENFKAPPLIKS